jgi:RNA polymerase sigma-70 factor, ECF subfamily
VKSDAELLESAHQGDANAFAALCERHRARVWRTVTSVTRRTSDAEDLAQEVFIKAFVGLKSYRGEASFSSWLTRIALNTAHDYQKSAWKRRVFFWQNGEQPDTISEIAPSLEEEIAQRARQKRVRAAVSALGEKERVPIWLIYFEEYSLAEVARLEGLPESTVRSRVKVGLKHLQLKLADLEMPEESLPWHNSENSGHSEQYNTVKNIKISSKNNEKTINRERSGDAFNGFLAVATKK